MDYASSLLGLLPGGRHTPGLKELLSTVGTYLPEDQVSRIREAAEFGASAHKGQKRLSGEPYIAHPVATAARIHAVSRASAWGMRRMKSGIATFSSALNSGSR